MYTFALETSLAHSWAYLQNSGSSSTSYFNNGNLFLFGGTPPVTQEDIDIELAKSPAALARTSLAYLQMAGPMETTQNVCDFNYSNVTCHMPVAGAKLFPELGRYVYNPSLMSLSRTAAGASNMEAQAQNAYDPTYFAYPYQEEAEFYYVRELQDLFNISVLRYRESRLNKENYSNNLNIGRYAYRYPIVFDFGTEVPIDSLWIMNGSNGSAYTSTTLIIERWDSATEQWVSAETLTPTDIVNGNSAAMLVDLVTPFTTSKVRMTMGDTGSQNPYLRFVHWCSKVDPAVLTSPVDITWGAVVFSGSATNNITDFGEYHNMRHDYMGSLEDSTRNKGYPMLYLDVGEPGSDAAVILNKATQVEPFTEINLLSLNLKISGGSE